MVDENGGFISVFFTTHELFDSTSCLRRKIAIADNKLEIVLIKRRLQQADPNTRLITISLVNRAMCEKSVDEFALFQSGIRIKCASGTEAIIAYPDLSIATRDSLSPETDEMVNKLLYRQHKTFAIGHGCAADWDGVSPAVVSQVWTDVMPTYEIPTISPDLFVKTDHGSVLFRSSMRKLGGLDALDDGFGEVDQLISLYQNWIDDLKINLVKGDQE